MTPEAILEKVCDSIDVLVEAGKAYEGLFPSLLDLGQWPVAYVALIALCIYRLTEDERLLSWAEGAGRWYLKTPFPEGVSVPAMDAGLGVELLADLYDLTGDASWLERGFELTETLISIYMDGDLIRGAAGIDWYESQMVPGDLLHGLARLALLALDRDGCPLRTNYTAK